MEVGCDPRQTFQDVPRLRVAYPADYLTTGIAYAHHPHRDTWYSAPPCQLNWWMPIYDFDANQGMAFHPRYWGVPTKNSSADFNYYRWNADGRKNAAQHVKSDTRVQPHATETLDPEPGVRLVVPAGGIILFSGAQMHSTVRNETSLARWSIDFRTVNLDDLANCRGPSTPIVRAPARRCVIFDASWISSRCRTRLSRCTITRRSPTASRFLRRAPTAPRAHEAELTGPQPPHVSPPLSD